MTEQYRREAHDKAIEVLRSCSTSSGFRASGLAAGYPQIWTRDNAIVALGAIASGDEVLLATVRACLQTLAAYQSPRGLVPLNVNPDTGYTSTENAGAVDANLWYILLHFLYLQTTGDVAFLREHWETITKALRWLEFQDMNECGLLEIPEAGNWMDLIAVRYNSLYDNVLYYAVSLAYDLMRQRLPADLASYTLSVHTAQIHERINLLMWIDRCWVGEHFAQHLERLKAIRLEWFMLYHNIGTISSRPYYLPWVAFREFGDWFDTLGNCLAILTGIADYHRSEHIVRYMHQVGIAEPYPSKAINPPISPGESDWREYYRSRNLNLPHQYHNGGIWPMVGGFHIAALVRHKWQNQAEKMLDSLIGANREASNGEWGFNEWMHGTTGHPMGFDQQAWSASMYLYAEHAVQTGRLPLFDDLTAAKPESVRTTEINDFQVRAGGGPV